MYDETLMLQALKNKDRRAENEFVAAHLKSMRAYCFHKLQQWEKAEDAAQNGFMEFFRQIDKVEDRGPGGMQVFLKGIMNYECSDEQTAQCKCPEDQPEVMPDGTQAPHISDKFSCDHIIAVVNTLVEGQRDVLLMHADGYTHKEIAAKLNITESTSRAYLNDGRIALGEILEENGIYYKSKANQRRKEALEYRKEVALYEKVKSKGGLWFCKEDWCFYRIETPKPPSDDQKDATEPANGTEQSQPGTPDHSAIIIPLPPNNDASLQPPADMEASG